MFWLRRDKVYRFGRFVLVGGFATALHYGIYWLLMQDMNVSLAYSIGYVCSFVVNYLLTTIFTFRSKASVKNGLGFGVSHLINYLLHVVLLNVFLLFGFDKSWAPVPVFCIAIPLNFLLLSLVYKNTQK